MNNQLDQAKNLLRRVLTDKDPPDMSEIEDFLQQSEPSTGNSYLVATEGDGLDTIFHAGRTLIVPIETLDEDRKRQLEAGNYEKLLNHGGEFPAIYLTEILEALEETGKLKEMLDSCQNTRARLDGGE